MSQLLLSPQSTTWRFKGMPKEVEIPYYDNSSMLEVPDTELPILILGGYGENHRITSQTIQKLGKQQIAAVGVILPYKDIPADRSIIEAASIEMPHIVGDHLKERFDLEPEAPMRTINHSQGGAAWALARRERPEGFGDTVLWAPVGFNIREDNRTPESRRIANFVSRFLLNSVKQNPLDPAVLPAGVEVLDQAIFDVRTRRFVPKVGLAVSLHLQRDAIDHVNDGFDVGILIGKRDSIFRKEEISDALRASTKNDERKPQILDAPGSHPNMNTRTGMKQLKVATDFLLRKS